jgi:hypothetical protein
MGFKFSVGWYCGCGFTGLDVVGRTVQLQGFPGKDCGAEKMCSEQASLCALSCGARQHRDVLGDMG